jgi:hypothetical protein
VGNAADVSALSTTLLSGDFDLEDGDQIIFMSRIIPDYDLDGDTPFAEFALARIRDEVEQAVTDDSSGPDVGGLSELTVTDLTATDRSVTDEPAIELSAIDLSARRDHRVR